jgi:hypothetical protein
VTEPQFSKLTELPLRDAWGHEAHDFTPWLATNIEHLSEAIGIPLELTGTEIAVDAFSADILARNSDDDSVVLIENQLEMTDHTHLGQIMTYLAGLDAETVIWIAPKFREPHLSAIHWLNENTADGFSFIAVKARVVRIGDSPFAPIFEVVAKPDDWSRQLQQRKKSVSPSSDPHSDTRLAFWSYYAEKYPDATEVGISPRRNWNAYFPFFDGKVRLSVWIGERNCGVYVGGKWGDKFSALEILGPFLSELAITLNSEASAESASGHILGEHIPLSYTNQNDWDKICSWMEERRTSYTAAINALESQTA